MLLLNIAVAGQYLHHLRVPHLVHRDVKSTNVLLTDTFGVKLCDFGLSREGDVQQGSANPPSFGWAAPEVLRGSAYGRSADVFSFGVVMWEVVSLEQPWHWIHHSHAVYREVADNGARLEFPAREDLMPPMPLSEDSTGDVYEVYKLLARECWREDPALRPDFNAIIQRLKHLISMVLKLAQAYDAKNKAAAAADKPRASSAVPAA